MVYVRYFVWRNMHRVFNSSTECICTICSSHNKYKCYSTFLLNFRIELARHKSLSAYAIVVGICLWAVGACVVFVEIWACHCYLAIVRGKFHNFLRVISYVHSECEQFASDSEHFFLFTLYIHLVNRCLCVYEFKWCTQNMIVIHSKMMEKSILSDNGAYHEKA